MTHFCIYRESSVLECCAGSLWFTSTQVHMSREPLLHVGLWSSRWHLITSKWCYQLLWAPTGRKMARGQGSLSILYSVNVFSQEAAIVCSTIKIVANSEAISVCSSQTVAYISSRLQPWFSSTARSQQPDLSGKTLKFVQTWLTIFQQFCFKECTRGVCRITRCNDW